MSSPSSSAPAPESPDVFMPPVEGRLFSKKLSHRLRRSATDVDPLTSESAKNVLEAERLAVEALMMIHDLRTSQPSKVRAKGTEEKKEAIVEPEAEPTPEAKVFRFPAVPQPKVIEPEKNENSEDHAEKPAGFQPVVYDASPSEEDDSGLDEITVGEEVSAEADERVSGDFGMDEGPTAPPDEWDTLLSMVEARKFAKRVLQKADQQKPEKPKGNLPKRSKGRKN